MGNFCSNEVKEVKDNPDVEEFGGARSFKQAIEPSSVVAGSLMAGTQSLMSGSTSRFFEAAITCLPGEDQRGPEWEGTLRLEHLLEMVHKMKMTDLGEDEVKRIWANLAKDHHQAVTVANFAQAVRQEGPAKRLLQNLIEQYDNMQTLNFSIPERYDFHKSTNDNYGVNNREFYGEYAEYRGPVDYSYHTNYTKARQAWQDSAISRIVTKTNRQSKPWLVYTCGPMGVGKGYALSWMSKHGYFPLESIVHVDPDGFKLMMPEWPGYVDKIGSEAGTLCHKESTFMMEIAQAVAMAGGQNIWIDGSLRNAEFYREQFIEVREKFPHYQISIFYVTATEECIRDRIKERAKKTGRDVPEALIQASLQAMDRSLNTLTPLCNFVARIDNNGSQPKLKAFETVNTTGVWGLISNRFAQQADVHTRFPHAIEPMLLLELPKQFLTLLNAAQVGGAEIVTMSFPGSSQTDTLLLKKLHGFLNGAVTLHASPRHPVTLPLAARKRAGICESAAKFMFVSAPRDYDGRRLDKVELESRDFSKEDQQHILIQFLRKGGFCYLDLSGKVVQFNVAVSGHDDNCAALQFGAPQDVPIDKADAIADYRYCTVGSVLMRSLGALKYAWVLPGEQVAGGSGRSPCPHGGFLYLIDAPGQGGRKAKLYPVLD
mmetsp:Transcript_47/g.135  ORF Transcript_47/g.135 Transcript_47/m.135 type:complete len:657 (+) Transcript_47:21-1991(+)